MITGFFGSIGCGKTTVLTSVAQSALKTNKYQYVYTNFVCKGCYQIDFSALGNVNLENSLILLDEITLDADNRQFKSFPKSALYFFTMSRHYHCDIVYATQNWQNVDKKIRDLTTSLFYVRSAFTNIPWLSRIFPITKYTSIYRTVDIDEINHEIVCGYRFATFFERLLGRVTRFVWRPRWYRYFDSFEKPLHLPEFTPELW